MKTIEEIIKESPDNFVIQNALCRCFEIIEQHNKIVVLVSGGADSDVVLDIMIRCGCFGKTEFVFIDTGLEYQATREHIDFLEQKYGINIHRVKSPMSIPNAIHKFGVPFWGKFASEMLYRLQSHGFKFEDEPFDVLIKKYPKCKTALSWWCDVRPGKTTLFSIARSPYLKEFMVANPPDFPISNKCCDKAKKDATDKFMQSGEYDLCCIGIRRYEGGIRAAHKTCFTEEKNGADNFRPIYWFRDSDREQYCKHYGVAHSRCYTEYGLIRTGCFGCPFGKRFEDELQKIQGFEPKLLRAANAIFERSYEYTRQYMKFREQKSAEKKAESKKNFSASQA